MDTAGDRRVTVPKQELAPGERKVINVGRREIVVINDDGIAYALFNRCPHQQAPLDPGRLSGAPSHGPVGSFHYDPARRVLRCPWHHYEFDLSDGRCLADPTRLRVATYEVTDEGDRFVVSI